MQVSSDLIEMYDELIILYSEEYIEMALDLLIGKINNCFMYGICNNEELDEIMEKNSYFFAIGINDKVFIPTYRFLENYPVVVDRNGKIDYRLISSMCRDLNKILSIYETPIKFNSFKIWKNGKLRNVNYEFHDKHFKVDSDRFRLLTIELSNRFDNGDDEELDKIVDNLYSENINDNTSLNFSEYSNFIGSMTGYDLLGRVYKPKKVEKIEEVKETKIIKPKLVKGKKIEEIKETKIIKPKLVKGKKVEEVKETKIIKPMDTNASKSFKPMDTNASKSFRPMDANASKKIIKPIPVKGKRSK